MGYIAVKMAHAMHIDLVDVHAKDKSVIQFHSFRFGANYLPAKNKTYKKLC